MSVNRGGIAGAVELDRPATDVSSTIADANGSVAQDAALGAQPAGTITYDWNGKDAAGNAIDARPVQGHGRCRERRHHRHRARSGLGTRPVRVRRPPAAIPSLNITGLGQVPTSAIRSIA